MAKVSGLINLKRVQHPPECKYQTHQIGPNRRNVTFNLMSTLKT